MLGPNGLNIDGMKALDNREMTGQWITAEFPSTDRPL